MIKFDRICSGIYPYYEKEQKKKSFKYDMRGSINLVMKRMKDVSLDDIDYEEFYYLTREDELKYKLCDDEFRSKYDFLK